MKLPYQQLEQHVSKKLAPVYLISGDELLQTQEAVDLIRQAAQNAGFSERTRVMADAEWGKQLYTDAHSLSLFATKRILELDLRGAKLTQANSEYLKNYAEKPQEDTLLLIHANKLDAKTEQTAWYKTLDKNGVIVTVWPIPTEQLPQWIMQRAKKIQLTLSKQAAIRLAEQVEGNLLAAAQEIEKLRLLTDSVDENMLENIIADHAHFDIFNLVDSLLSGNAQRSLRILDNLRAEETEPTLILWAITRELRTMSLIMQQTEQGVALSALFSKFRIWEKRQPSARAFLKRHKQKSCHALLLAAAKVDRMIKGAEAGNLWNELEQIVYNFTYE